MDIKKSTATSFHIGRVPATKTTKLYFNTYTQLGIIAKTNHACLFLLEYWLKNMARPRYIIDDKKTAIALGCAVTTIRNNRLKLQKANLFHIIRTSNLSNIHLEYCLGVEGVLTRTVFEKEFGVGSVGELRRKFQNNISKLKLEMSNDIDPVVLEDILYLFNPKYQGQFDIEEAV